MLNPIAHPQTVSDWCFVAGLTTSLIILGLALPWWIVAVLEAWEYHHKGSTLAQRLSWAWGNWRIYREARQRAARYLGPGLLDTPHGDAVVQRIARNLSVRRLPR